MEGIRGRAIPGCVDTTFDQQTKCITIGVTQKRKKVKPDMSTQSTQTSVIRFLRHYL